MSSPRIGHVGRLDSLLAAAKRRGICGMLLSGSTLGGAAHVKRGPDETQSDMLASVAGLSADLAAKYARLQAILRDLGSVLVAYSGGVDSALLLKVATDVLGARAVGALAS